MKAQKMKQIKETRSRLLEEIRSQLKVLNDHAGDDNPLLIMNTSRSLVSLIETYLSTLPPTYRGDDAQ
mgnify:CR=1 FL=1